MTNMTTHPIQKPSSSAGFTLIEVVVALTVTAILATMGTELLRAAQGNQERLAERRLAWDRDQNARRWVDEVLRGARSVGVGHPGFVGQPDELALPTRLETATGRDTTTIWIGLQQGRLIARTTVLEEVTLWRDVEDIAFDYLIEPGLDSRWVREWQSPLRLPLVVRLRIRRRAPGVGVMTDTIVVSLGARG